MSRVIFRTLLLASVIVLRGEAEAAPSSPASPAPPGTYSLPASPILVHNGNELVRALASASPHDIVLRDGSYGSGRPFENACGHRLYAEHTGGAVLNAGLSVGSNGCSGGGRVQGLAFAVSDPKVAVNGAAIEVWGTARNTTLADITVDGHSMIDAGVIARQPEGLRMHRVAATGFRSYGVLVDADVMNFVVADPPILEDIDVANVSRPVPGESDGTAEACIWVGNTAVGRRFRARNCSWMGLWTGTAARGALFTDIDIDHIGSPGAPSTGLYLEHFTTDTIFERVRIGPNVTVGIECEWADPAWASLPGCDGVIIQDSLIESRCVGTYFDEGTRNTTIRRTTFVNQSRAAIAVFNKNHNVLYDTTGNDYRMMRSTAQVLINENNPCDSAAPH